MAIIHRRNSETEPLSSEVVRCCKVQFSIANLGSIMRMKVWIVSPKNKQFKFKHPIFPVKIALRNGPTIPRLD